MLLGIDPGYTSGTCLCDQIVSGDNFNVIAAIEMDWVHRLHMLDMLIGNNARALRAIVIERFKLFGHEDALRNQIGSEMPSSRIIGAVEALAFKYGIFDRIVFQEPWARKQLSILPQHRSLVGISDHTQDAYRHIRYYIATNYR